MGAAEVMARPATDPLPSGGSGRGGAKSEPVDWSVLIPYLVHPTKVIVIEAMLWIERPMSATELEKVSGGTPVLSAFSYHLKQLAEISVLEMVEKRKARKVRGGRKETFFYFARRQRSQSATRRDSS